MLGRRPDAAGLRRLTVDCLHVAALSAFAIAQPIFDLLASTAQFFGVRGSTSAEIVVFAVAVVVVPLLVALVVEGLVGLAGEAPRRFLHLLFVGGLVLLITARALKKAFDPAPSVFALAALAVGVGGALLYARYQAVRSVVSVLIPAPLVFLAIFLFFSPVEKLVFPEEAHASLVRERARNDVVFLILDEFPTSSLMDSKGRIDAARFPNFADLARHSTWFRNATGEHEGTHAAVPAILDARLPRRGRQPTFDDHPQNLFTLLGGHYRMNVWETQTHLCPTSLCRGKGELSRSFVPRMHSLFEDAGIVYLHMVVPTAEERRLPDVGTAWGHFRRVADRGARFERQRFESFVESIQSRRSRPTLNLAHILLPHGTWELLPSCHRYPTPDYSPGIVLPGKRWGSNAWLVAQADQRHLLQVQCTDRLLGELVRKLREERIYDESVLIVTADQGVSVRPNQSRRSVDPAHPSNLADLAFVPLFFKRPGQQTGAVDDRHVRTLDIAPTIAEVLGIRMPWAVDGRSLTGPEHSEQVSFMTDRGVARADVRSLERQRERILRRNDALFGAGLIALGPHPELLGQRVASLRVVRATARASVDGDIAGLLASLPSRSDTVPAQVMGSVTGPGADPNRPIALAVNGRIEAVSLTYREGSSVRYSAMAAESALHPGTNDVELFWIVGTPAAVELESLGP